MLQSVRYTMIQIKQLIDLYCGWNSPEELFYNWSALLQALRKANLRLSASKTAIKRKTIKSASKTVIKPKTTTNF